MTRCGPWCMGMMRLSETLIQVRKEQNSTVSRTCGVVTVCIANSGRSARSVSAWVDEPIKKTGDSTHTSCGMISRP